MDEERWRVFCTVELPFEVRERATRHVERLRVAVPNARPSCPRAENLHLTIKFLGEILRNRVEQLSQAAERATDNLQAFNLTIEGAGAFPPRGIPRVLWLGIKDSSSTLAKLQKSLEDECAATGFAREDRPFHPHLTLCRVRAPQDARRLVQVHRETGFEASVFDVMDFVVMRSELGPGGSRYTEISRHSLGI